MLVILVGMIGQARKHDLDVPYDRIIMDCGQNNYRRYIDVGTVQQRLEEKCTGLSTALVGLHAMTGSDFTSCFYNKGKVAALSLLEHGEAHGLVEAFQCLGQEEELETSRFEIFVAGLYGFRNCSVLNVARRQKLYQLAGWKKGQKPDPKKMQQIDSALLPPCLNTMKLKIARVQHVSKIWTRATAAKPSEGLDPLQSGWKKDEGGHLVPIWYRGPALPENVQLIEEIEEEQLEVEADATEEVDYTSSSDEDEEEE